LYNYSTVDANEDRVSGYNEAQSLHTTCHLAATHNLSPCWPIHWNPRNAIKSCTRRALIWFLPLWWTHFRNPYLSDAAILTGISYNGSTPGAFLEAFGLRIANEQAVGNWAGRDNGCLTWIDAFANVAIFYHGDSYDKEVLWYTEDVKQPVAAIEFLTVASLPQKAPNFTGPVMASFV
jgi:hypothetical protein